MVVVIVGNERYELRGRLAEVVQLILRNSERLRDGSKVLRLCLRRDSVTATIEEEV